MSDWSSPPLSADAHVFRRAVPVQAAKIWAAHAWSEMQHRRPDSEWASRAVAALIEASETGESQCKIVGSFDVLGDVLDWCESIPGWYYGDVPVWMYSDIEEQRDHDIPTQTDG